MTSRPALSLSRGLSSRFSRFTCLSCLVLSAVISPEQSLDRNYFLDPRHRRGLINRRFYTRSLSTSAHPSSNVRFLSSLVTRVRFARPYDPSTLPPSRINVSPIFAGGYVIFQTTVNKLAANRHVAPVAAIIDEEGLGPAFK